jgi:hypothetical protein
LIFPFRLGSQHLSYTPLHQIFVPKKNKNGLTPYYNYSQTKDITQPIQIILDGSNYPAWAQSMSRWLKGHCLWEYVFGEELKPIAGEKESNAEISSRLRTWQSTHYMIISWFANTCVASISLTFGNLDNANEVWDTLAQRYNTTNLTQRFQIATKFNHMCQEPCQNIIDFYSQMTYLWNQLSLCEP